LNISAGEKEVVAYYMLSLAVSDLLCGVFMIPLSIHPTLIHHWEYGSGVCRLMGYAEVVLWIVQVYMFMWIGVDRYVAIRKPLRYDTIQTKTKCHCWIVITWLTAVLSCCPPLLSFSEAFFDEMAHVCLFNFGDMFAYAATLTVIVLSPTVITTLYTNIFILWTMIKMRHGTEGTQFEYDKEYTSAVLETLSNPSHVVSIVLVLVFWVSWIPWILAKIYRHFSQTDDDWSLQLFALFWLGILNSFWKLVIYSVLSPKFRHGLRAFCLSLCCKSTNSYADYDDW
jgi:hypothetical protein